MAYEFAVIGLGRFGTGVALSLARAGCSVVGVDHDREIVRGLAEQLDDVIEADGSDETVLRQIGVSDFDSVVVAIGDFECNLLSTVALKHLEARHIVAKALTRRQAEILLRIGAHEIVLPEQEAGELLAARLLAPNISQALLQQTGVAAGERLVPEEWVGRSLAELAIRPTHGVLVIAIRRGTRLITAPGADDSFEIGDQIVLTGPEPRLRELGCHPHHQHS